MYGAGLHALDERIGMDRKCGASPLDDSVDGALDWETERRRWRSEGGTRRVGGW